MREIKFRGRNPLTKQWEYGFLITVDLSSEKLSKNLTAIIKENAWYEPSEGIGEFKLVEPETVGQFTGKIDTNKKEIYQGDIADITIFNSYEDTSQKHRMIVEFYEGSWVFYKSVDDTLDLYWVCFSDNDYKVEVIGNIHDNPEMLEVSNA